MNYEEKYKKALDRAMNLFVTNNISATAVCEIFPELNESKEINYEKKYKKALEWMQSLYNGLHGATKEDAEHYFPELKESEDEKIRKTIIEYIKGIKSWDYFLGISKEQMIAWLEKQDKQSYSNIPSREIILAIWELGNDWKELTNGSISTEYGTQLDYIQKHWHESEYYLKEKQGEKKPADKVEPKFKVGDWVILNDIVAQILDKQKYGFVGLDTDGKDFFCNYGHTDSMRLWTINDAKDGDVLVNEDNNIGLYLEKKDDLYWYSRIYLGCDNRLRGFSIGAYHKHNNTKPATKEQRDLLFQKMKEAGYEWDSEKKELKKIEPKKVNADKVIAWLVANICDFEYYVELFKKDFGL